jgi:methylated-DNA-[protein]-cysteine S-methyltransferase
MRGLGGYETHASGEDRAIHATGGLVDQSAHGGVDHLGAEERKPRSVQCRELLSAAARAAGNALGANPLPIVIPCHRVRHASGGLGGYTGGLERKRLLLAIESGAN